MYEYCKHNILITLYWKYIMQILNKGGTVNVQLANLKKS